MGREVLGLVHHQVLLGDAAAPDVGEGLHAEVAGFLQLAAGHGAAAPGFGVGGDDELEVVVDGLHVGAQLLADVARQVAQVPAHGHDGAAHEDLVVGLVIHHLLKAGGNGHQGLAGARLAQEGDHLDRGIQQQLHGELLLPVAGLDAPGVGVHALQGAQQALPDHEAGQGGVAGIGQVDEGEELVGLEGQGGVRREAAVVELIHLGRGHFPGAVAGVELVHLHHVGGVVLGLDADGVGLDAQVGVLGDQHHPLLASVQQLPGTGQDLVVSLVLVR